MILVTNPHRVGFLVAEKSYNTRIIGDFAKAVGSIPVSRPQDQAQKGQGKISFDGLKVLGQDTKFTQIQRGDKIRPGRSPTAYKLKDVVSDTEATLAEELGEMSPLQETTCQGQWADYDILKFVDQGDKYEHGVWIGPIARLPRTYEHR